MRKHRNPIRCYALFTHRSVPGSMGHSGLLKPLPWNYLYCLPARSRIWGKEQKELAHLRRAQVTRRFRNVCQEILGLLAPHLLYSTSKASKYITFLHWLDHCCGRSSCWALHRHTTIYAGSRSLCIACCSFAFVTPCESTHQFLMSLAH